jgi:2-succinyl-6-hydroxy-2,4-cyclohexadiene-1-carboxylate synthase
MAHITLLHGFSQSGASWDELVRMLPAGLNVIAPDLRGHGANPTSAGEPHTLSAATEDVLRGWDELGLRRSHLVGYSLGGRLALHLAAHHPERVETLAVISAHAGFEGEARARRQTEDQALAARIESEGVDWFATYWAALPLFAGLARRGPEFLAAVDARRRRNRPEGLAAALLGMGGAATEPFWDRLPAIDAPTLVIVGAEDEPYLARGRRLVSLIPDARLEIVAGAGHAAHLEQPKAVAALLTAQLSRR